MHKKKHECSECGKVYLHSASVKICMERHRADRNCTALGHPAIYYLNNDFSAIGINRVCGCGKVDDKIIFNEDDNKEKLPKVFEFFKNLQQE